MAEKKDNHWLERAFSNAHGQLRAKTGTKSGSKISERKLEKATHSRSGKTRKQAQLAETARKINSRRK